MLKKLELKNYKSHKHYVAEFNGNSIIEGNKGSGKTSLKDAFYWVMTGSMVDDPTPVDKNGVIINHLTISATATLTDGTILGVESSQRWVKDKLQSRHNQTYFVNGTPMIQRDYLAHLEEKYGTLEQRKIMLEPDWFAHGDGLRVTGKTSKTATQRRREIVIGIAGVGDLEEQIATNEEKAKQAKYAISQLKKELNDANAGIESLHDAKVDTTHFDIEVIKESISQLEQEKDNTYNALNNLDVDSTLQEAYSKARVDLSNAEAQYSIDYNKRLEQARKPLNEYNEKKQELQTKLSTLEYENKELASHEHNLIKEIDELKQARQEALIEFQEINNSKYNPDSVTCECCGQVLPPDKIREHEARFNKQRSDRLERIINHGNDIKHDIEHYEKQLSLLEKPHDLTALEKELKSLVEPKVEAPKRFEETKEYDTLNKALNDAYNELQNASDDSAKEVYERAIDNLNAQIGVHQQNLNMFETNKHLDNQIELKGEELRDIAERLDEQEDILEKANEFVRKTLTALEDTIEEKFNGIRFKMFEYTLDGTQKDTCITYGETEHGYIPWESLSGGQKRSATINLSNAFTKAWGVEMPLWIDDTQIYSDDEVKAQTQLIRITEVPYKELVVK